MKRVLIWDLPVRVLHWVFAASTSAALWCGLALGREHAWFGYHAWAAMVAAGALLLRVGWGFVGSRHARFAAWSWRPMALWRFLGSLTGRAPGGPHAGHNPAASWVMLGLLLLVGALVGTGLAGGEDPHRLLAQVLPVFIGLHLGGLIWHAIRHRENIVMAMVDGRKRAEADAALAGPSRKAGLVMALILAAWVAVLARGYDHAAGTLTLPFLKQPLILTDGAGDETGGME